MKKLHTTIKLPATLPKLILISSDVFTGWIDSDFKDYGLTSDVSKDEQMIEVHELTKNATFHDMFNSFGKNLDDLVVSQGQVIEFAKTLENNDKYDYFFLLKNSENEFFVAGVGFYGGGQLGVYVYRFSGGYVWRAGFRLRVVFPQLDSKSLRLCPSDTLTLERAIEIVKKEGYVIYKPI